MFLFEGPLNVCYYVKTLVLLTGFCLSRELQQCFVTLVLAMYCYFVQLIAVMMLLCVYAFLHFGMLTPNHVAKTLKLEHENIVHSVLKHCMLNLHNVSHPGYFFDCFDFCQYTLCL